MPPIIVKPEISDFWTFSCDGKKSTDWIKIHFASQNSTNKPINTVIWRDRSYLNNGNAAKNKEHAVGVLRVSATVTALLEKKERGILASESRNNWENLNVENTQRLLFIYTLYPRWKSVANRIFSDSLTETKGKIVIRRKAKFSLLLF